MLNKLFFRNKFFIPLLTLPIILSFIGLIFIFEASSVTSFKEFGDSLHYLKLQLLWLGIGLAAMIFFAILDYHKLYYLAFLFITSSIILLMGVLIPGIGSQAGGARRWLNFGFLNIQPSELAKFSVIIYLASWFTYKERKRFFAFLILLGFLTFLVILQPDMGTAIIIFLLSVIIYFLSGGSLLHFLLLLPVSVLIFYLLIKISPYRFNRLIAFLNPNIDPLGITYHINQI
ncbi:MAG: FtsW/RodA/SpoVE family cell cycle protein, partial [Microgenomates group bacterium]